MDKKFPILASPQVTIMVLEHLHTPKSKRYLTVESLRHLSKYLCDGDDDPWVRDILKLMHPSYICAST